MLINGSLVADMKGIKEIKRKRLEKHWERIPEQNKRDITLKKKTKKVRYQSLQDQKGYREKKTQKSASCFAWSAIDLTHKETPPSAKKCLV